MKYFCGKMCVEGKNIERQFKVHIHAKVNFRFNRFIWTIAGIIRFVLFDILYLLQSNLYTAKFCFIDIYDGFHLPTISSIVIRH